MNSHPQPRLADIGPLWADMADIAERTAVRCADVLRDTAIAMRVAADPDFAARHAIEGAREWRSCNAERSRQ